jgi:hypothetical protein
VKLPTAPPQASFNFGAATINASFDRLFDSIRPARGGLGATPAPEWYILTPSERAAEVNAWDLCHHVTRQGFGVAGLASAQFAEPDLEQQWVTGTAVEHAMAVSKSCDKASDPESRLPPIPFTDPFWFRDPNHSQLEAARTAVGQPADRVRIAHCDTGYYPNQETLPRFLRRDLQKNFVDNGSLNDATDHTSGILTNLGHGTGTLSILAGAKVDGVPLGGAPFLDIIPIRVANSVVLFRNSAIAKAFDFVHGLFGDMAKRAHVISMSMGGLASQAWADAVNALYELGVFIVTAAGNNFFNLPTHNIVYPARFKRVVAACGVMADGRPYADLPINIMAGNYGPASKMATAMAAFTPNTPWARLGCSAIVDHDGKGTSAATPQIAAAAALWIQTFKNKWEAYPQDQGWMRVEAVRKALFDAARLDNSALGERLGRGVIQANSALSQQPANASALQKQPVDTASFPFLRVITGLGIAAAPQDAHQRMLELEALQLSQRSLDIEQLLPDHENVENISAADRHKIVDALHEAAGASKTLRDTLEKHRTPGITVKPSTPAKTSAEDENRVKLAMDPPVPKPVSRKLRVFAFDPLLGYTTDLLEINQTILDVAWEGLQPGPVGEYIEVVDVDPSTGCCYAAVDLNHPTALSQSGLSPSEANPQFHQQMVYAVAMKTIEHFERALGRVALWAPRFVKYNQNGEDRIEKHYVQRLRIYPHALREANSFYSPDKKALLLGYFPASAADENLPGGTIFCSLSHDIIAHETTHALLDGLHRYFGEPSNEDVLAFHEAFADIVALFQHFTIPEALRDQIARTQGDLSKQNLLGELALQFGEGLGRQKALRSAIGQPPNRMDYQKATEAHDRGAVLVAAVFDAFLDVYRRRSADLIRLATSGTGVLPEGNIPHDLVNRLAVEASKTAGHVLNICIRALDYCPPVDLRFGEYVRALITADRDLVSNDKWGYRPAFIQGFRRRGIFPENVRNLSSDSLCWERPETRLPLEGMFKDLQLTWDLHVDRRKAFRISQTNGWRVHEWLKNDPGIKDSDAEALGFYRGAGNTLKVGDKSGKLRDFEVHSVRPVRRIGPDGQQETDLVVEITQSWLPDDGSGKFRGGCTLVVDLESRSIRYVVRKRVGHPDRLQEQEQFQMKAAEGNLDFSYFGDELTKREPFAMLHRDF